MEKKIITISREFGSGGRTIGRKVAEKLGIPFYARRALPRRQPVLLCLRPSGHPRHYERPVHR